MAFLLYQSNRQEDLFTLFAAVLRQPRQGAVLSPEVVMVPSQGTAKWLTMSLAEDAGVAANLSFQLPGALIWSLIHALIPDVSEQSPYRPEVLTWRIYALLPTLSSASVKRYLEAADPVRQYALAHALARLYDAYLVYRPDWIDAWERGKKLGLGEDEAWQAQLWRQLKQGPHRANLLNTLLENIAPMFLPARILCFGVNNLPPIYLSTLQALGQYTDIHYFVLNPSQADWVDDRDMREQLRFAGDEDPEALYLTLGHPLLSSLGKQGRDFFAGLMQTHSIDVFADEAETPRKNLLQNLQADILHRVEEARPLAADGSILVNACHSAMREVDVLLDYLLHQLQDDPDLNPADILVLAPDIGIYRPYIEAVFADAPVRLPFSIADKPPAIPSELLTFLTLPDARFDVDWVMNLLCPPLLRRFGLSLTHLPLLRDWITHVRIDWGRDPAHQGEVPTVYNWQSGLERLLLGCFLPQEMGAPPIYANSVPAKTIPLSQRNVLLGFISLMETLTVYANAWQIPQTVSGWADTLNQFFETSFQPDQMETQAFVLLQNHLALLAAEAEDSEALIPLSVLAHALEQKLSQTGNSAGFLGYGVTFCNMVPLRAVPAKVICVLGLNHDAFPRETARSDLDLMAQHPRTGDRSRRQDDRYLFLETLLSAREALYLSYIGRDIRTDQEFPPSVLVEELMETLVQQYQLPSKEVLLVQHFLQPFNPGYFVGDRPSFQTTWLAAAKAGQKTAQTPLFSSRLPVTENAKFMDLATLLLFYRYPVRILLQKQLGMTLPYEKPLHTSTYIPNERDRRLVRERILQYDADALAVLRGEGILAEGIFGEIPYAEEAQAVWQPNEKTQILTLPTVEHAGWTFTATLPRVALQKGIILHYLQAEPSASHKIGAWLQHLALCMAQPEGVPCQTYLSGLEKQFVFVPISQMAAFELMLPWLQYYVQGQQSPLPFFPQTSLAYATAHRKGKADALAMAQKKLMPSGLGYSEGEDRYVQAARMPELDKDFCEISRVLLGPLLDAMKD